MDKCITKFPTLRNQSRQRPFNNCQKPTGQRKYCKFCEKDGHTEKKCFLQEKAESKIKQGKARKSEVQLNFIEQSTT